MNRLFLPDNDEILLCVYKIITHAENMANIFPRLSHWCTVGKQVKAIIQMFSYFYWELGHMSDVCSQLPVCQCSELWCSQDSLKGSTVAYWTAAKVPHLSLVSTRFYSTGEVMMNHAVALAGRQRRTQPVFLDFRLTWAELMGLHLPVNEPESPERVIKHRLKAV